MSWWPFGKTKRSTSRSRAAAEAALSIDLARRIARTVDDSARMLGLDVVGDGNGAGLVIGPDRIIDVHDEWSDVPATDQAAMDGALVMLRKIWREHGPGRMWTAPQLAIVFPVFDNGGLVMLDAANKPVIRLRARYYHEACARPIAPPPEAS